MGAKKKTTNSRRRLAYSVEVHPEGLAIFGSIPAAHLVAILESYTSAEQIEGTGSCMVFSAEVARALDAEMFFLFSIEDTDRMLRDHEKKELSVLGVVEPL